MLGVRMQSLLVVPYNGDSIKVEIAPHETILVRVPAAWGDGWLDRARQINDAVAVATANTPEPSYCA
jgi:hypothetical protein